jgi:DNA (cytosine-5)-methyltransferase 1
MQTFSAGFSYGNSSKARSIGYEEERAPTIRAGAGGNSVPVILAVDTYNGAIDNVAQTVRGGGKGGVDVDKYGAVMQTSMAFAQNQREEVRDLNGVAVALQAEPGTHQQTFLAQPQVRRLTPMECERLQGFPDGWTEGQSDSARYRQMGNAVAVPCVEWIVQRLVETDAAMLE